MQRLTGKVVVVIGAAGSIGRVVTSALHGLGARVAASDVDGAPLEELRAELKEDCLVAGCDAADPVQVAELLAHVGSELGAVDALVNVAGYWDIVEFVASTPEHWQQMIRANLLTAMTACHAVLPSMLERGRGSIVNFASTAGEYGSIRPSAAYAAAKGGVIAFTKSLAREVSPHGVRANCVSPGPIDTPMLKAASPEERAAAASRTLVGRLGTPEDIAAGVAYLVSDESGFVTGEVLRINGGSLL